MKGFPLEFGIGVRGPKCLNDGATRWSKKLGFVVLIQYRLCQSGMRHLVNAYEVEADTV